MSAVLRGAGVQGHAELTGDNRSSKAEVPRTWRRRTTNCPPLYDNQQLRAMGMHYSSCISREWGEVGSGGVGWSGVSSSLVTSCHLGLYSGFSRDNLQLVIFFILTSILCSQITEFLFSFLLATLPEKPVKLAPCARDNTGGAQTLSPARAGKK